VSSLNHNPRILIVEDDPEIVGFLTIYLNKHGFEVTAATDGRKALVLFEQVQPDLVLLDVILPEIQGLELCRIIRLHSKTPIIFLSCKWETDDIVAGLGLGGNDYITKPFAPQELLARIKAILRDQNNHEQGIFTFGSLQINVQNYMVTVNEKPITLFAKELQLLLFLAQNPNRVFHANELHVRVWGDTNDSDLRTVMVHISNLRRKIEEDPKNPRWIRTVRGFGYLLNTKD
jgi:DNA-binding response OmpR family regulator